MKNKKKIISVVALLLIVILIVTATYAYFAAQTSKGSSTDINVTTGTVDNLTFETGDAISITATQTNFASGMTSLSDDTYAKATLIANNDTNSASANYYAYLNISTNEFEYTTDDSTAELILTITMDGIEVTSLDGYDYVSVTDGNSNVISGFDITNTEGLIILADNYLIESIGTEVDDWEITVTFVNLDTDQSENAGKNFSASLIIQQSPNYSLYTIRNACDRRDVLSSCIQSLYNITNEGTVGLYYFDGVGTYTNSDQEYVDYRYIYSGGTDDVNNFLCLGDDCTDTDNLYRILGIYLNDDNEYEVKVMKYEYSDSTLAIDSLSGWDSTSLYTWLNSTFLDTIEDYDNIITTHSWKIPTNYNGSYTALQHVSYVNDATSTVDAKIALIYDSDFAYASKSSYWSTNLSSYYNDSSSNWMYGEKSEWTLSFYRYSSFIYASAILHTDANSQNYFCIKPGADKCRAYYMYAQVMYRARPTFYLNSSVQYSSGSGTQNDPIRLVTE